MTVDLYPIRGYETLTHTFTKRIGDKTIRAIKRRTQPTRTDKRNTLKPLNHGNAD